MAANTRPGEPRKLLTAAEALEVLGRIDQAVENFCASAPRAVSDFGGRSAVEACCQMTCVGPVPRVPERVWEAMAGEHAERQWGRGRD